MNRTPENIRKLTVQSIAAVILIFCELFFFRNVIGNSQLFGDIGDGRLTNLLTEHWYNVLCGREKWNELCFFYPAENVLSYSDMLLGFGIFHSIFRLMGFNTYTAYKAALMTIHVIGTAATYILLKKHLNTGTLWALFGTVAFSFSNAFSLAFVHTQMTAVSFLPIMLILLTEAMKNFSLRKKRNICVCGFIAMFALTAYTSWYTAYFTGLFLLIMLFVYMILLAMRRESILKWAKTELSAMGIDLLLYAGLFILLFIPFLMLYLPALQMSGGYGYPAEYLPEFIDIANVTESNLMLGWLMDKMDLEGRGRSPELNVGFSMVLLLMFAAVFIYLMKHKRIGRTGGKFRYGSRIMILRAAAVTSIICMILPINLSSNCISLWIFVFKLIPGAQSIRAIARLFFWLSFPISVITAVCGKEIFSFIKNKKAYLSAVSAACLLLFVSNVNIDGVYSDWCTEAPPVRLENITPPPEDCKVFFITDDDYGTKPSIMYHLDAMEIANHFSVKTINGYSGQFPADWKIENITTMAYENNAKEWAASNGIEKLYIYNVSANEWYPADRLNMENIPACFDPTTETLLSNIKCSTGLNADSLGVYAWTDRTFTTFLRSPALTEKGITIKMEIPEEHFKAQDPSLSPIVSVYVNGTHAADVAPGEGTEEIHIPVTPAENDIYEIKLETEGYFRPSDIGLNSDSRELSLAVYYIGE